MRRAQRARARSGIRFLDVGTSGGIWGLESGFCLMVGGPRDAFEAVEPLLKALAPPRAATPTSARPAPATSPRWCTTASSTACCRPTPRASTCCTPSEFDLRPAAGRRRSGTTAASCAPGCSSWPSAPSRKSPELETLRGYVDDSGEGRWTVLEAVERGVPAPASSPQSLFARFASRDENSFAMRCHRRPAQRVRRPRGEAAVSLQATRGPGHHHRRRDGRPGAAQAAAGALQPVRRRPAAGARPHHRLRAEQAGATTSFARLAPPPCGSSPAPASTRRSGTTFAAAPHLRSRRRGRPGAR